MGLLSNFPGLAEAPAAPGASTTPTKKEEDKSIPWWVWLLVVLAVLGVLGGSAAYVRSKKSSN